MELLPAALRAYLDGLVPERPAELQAMEADAGTRQFPIIGPACGHLCYLLARMTGARSVFELGSGFGYSTAFFARAVQDNGGGVVHHVVWDQDLSRKAKGHLTALGFEGIVQYHVREAIEALGETEGPFDLIFNDIHKEAYPASLPVIEAKLKPGGVLIVDNMLWSGRVFDPAEVSEATEGVRELTRLVTASPQWTSTLVPIRDGLLVAFKKPN
jgi:predicted O-methyltransferase YrrM